MGHGEAVIGVDWGTTSLRAFRLAKDGAILARREEPSGILAIQPGGFPAALETAVGDWLDTGEDQVLLSGMVGSRQGWAEAPYAPCPAGIDQLGAALIQVPFSHSGRPVQVRIVPGVSAQDGDGVPDVMRGEETQIVGALPGTGAHLACLPGSHSKWAQVTDGRITGFTTHLTGEAFAALRGHTILGRMMQDGPTDAAAFEAGVKRAAQDGGLLHHLFGVRTQGLFGALSDAGAASYLSGLLIGHEVRAALPDRDTAEDGRRGPVHLIGAGPLCALYSQAILSSGLETKLCDPDAAALGMWRIGHGTSWT